jgi:RNA polymerase sigma factor (sigma-70 family)
MPEEPTPKKENADDQELASGFEATRKSLIAKLGNWEDQHAWDEFYRTYWKLIYSVALKSGLRSDEAFDVVQETILSIAKQSKKNLYDPEQGSFKSWLMNMTRWRINDQFRKRKKDVSANNFDFDDEQMTSEIERMSDPKADVLERMWESEWLENLTTSALEKVKVQVSPKQFQIFHCYVIQEWDAKKVQDHLKVSIAQVYLAKHRVGVIFRRELKLLEADERKNP